MSRGYSARESNVENKSAKELSIKELKKLRSETHSKELKLRKEVAKFDQEIALWLHETPERWGSYVLGKMTEADRANLNELEKRREDLKQVYSQASSEYLKADAKYQLSIMTPEQRKEFGYLYQKYIK